MNVRELWEVNRDVLKRHYNGGGAGSFKMSC